MLLEFVTQKTIEAAIALTRDLLKARIEEWNKNALEKKKARIEAREKEKSKKDRGLGDDLRSGPANISLTDDEIASARIDLQPEEVHTLLANHLRSVRQWSSSVGFSDLRGAKSTLDIYVDMDILVTPAKLHLDPVEKQNTLPLTTVISERGHHCIILGQPGAGKTTAMKKLCLSAMEPVPNASGYAFPLLLRLRDLQNAPSGGGIIIDELAKLFSFHLDVGGALGKPRASDEVDELKSQAFIDFLDAMNAIIVLDGFDEIPDDTKKPQIASEIRKLALQFSNAKMVLTCRTGEFNYSIDNSHVFEIAPLNKGQIESFAIKWLKDPDKANKFIKEVYDSPFADTAIKPLSLSHLCAIYERIGKVPEKPKTVYRKVVGLLLEEWDEQRAVKRYSRYAGFEPDRKFEFLSHLAYYLTTTARSSVFSRADFLDGYHKISPNFALDESQGNLVVVEVESHTGLFVQSGYDQFEFAHKSIQEYLAAEYLVKLPSIPGDKSILQGLGAEIAIAISLSSNPSMYLSDLGLRIVNSMRLSSTFYAALVNRIMLERPVFYLTDEVVISLCSILSAWINEGDTATPRSSPKDMVERDQMIYSELLSLIGKADAPKVICKYYDLHVSVSVGTGFVLARRRANLSGFKAPPYLLFPKPYAAQSLHPIS